MLIRTKFGVVMIWHEPQNHYDHCYFCAFDLVELNKRTKLYTKFSHTSHTAYFDGIPIPVFKESALSYTKSSEHHKETSDLFDKNQDDNFFIISNQPQLFDQNEFNDLREA